MESSVSNDMQPAVQIFLLLAAILEDSPSNRQSFGHVSGVFSSWRLYCRLAFLSLQTSFLQPFYHFGVHFDLKFGQFPAWYLIVSVQVKAFVFNICILQENALSKFAWGKGIEGFKPMLNWRDCTRASKVGVVLCFSQTLHKFQRLDFNFCRLSLCGSPAEIHHCEIHALPFCRCSANTENSSVLGKHANDFWERFLQVWG